MFARARSAPSSVRTAPANPRCSTSSTASTTRSRAACRFKGEVRRRMDPHSAAAHGIARTFQNIALFKGMSVLDNIMTGRSLKMKADAGGAGCLLGPQPERGDRAACQGRGDHRLPADRTHPQDTGRAAPLRTAETRGAGPRAGRRAGPAAAGRADGGHERGGERGHVPLHPRRERRVRHDHRADRARHGCGHGYLRPHRGARLRAQDRRWVAGGGAREPGGDRCVSWAWRIGCNSSSKSSSAACWRV